MRTNITEQIAKNEHPLEYAAIIKDKKYNTMNNGSWCYEYGVKFSMNIQEKILETEQDVIDDITQNYIISLCCVSGRKIISSLLQNNPLPTTFINLTKDNFKEIDRKNYIKVNKDMNLSGGGLSLFDLGQLHPEIIEKYKKLSDGKKLITFDPDHMDSDEWGFTIENVITATRRLKQAEVRFIVNDMGFAYTVEGNYVCFIGALGCIDKALDAKSGSEFVGWHKTRQYKLTEQEICDILKGRIFSDGGIKF